MFPVRKGARITNAMKGNAREKIALGLTGGYTGDGGCSPQIMRGKRVHVQSRQVGDNRLV